MEEIRFLARAEIWLRFLLHLHVHVAYAAMMSTVTVRCPLEDDRVRERTGVVFGEIMTQFNSLRYILCGLVLSLGMLCC